MQEASVDGMVSPSSVLEKGLLSRFFSCETNGRTTELSQDTNCVGKIPDCPTITIIIVINIIVMLLQQHPDAELLDPTNQPTNPILVRKWDKMLFKELGSDYFKGREAKKKRQHVKSGGTNQQPTKKKKANPITPGCSLLC